MGNPPFIGAKYLRELAGITYVETLWSVHNDINESADFVMYWWDRAAEIVATNKTARRFGLVTTNSIAQTFSRRVVARHLKAKKPISILMAIPDHPWTKTTDRAAAVRIAMTVGCAGRHDGVLREVASEAKLDTDQPEIEFTRRIGRINADLTIGADVTTCEPLRANEGLSSPGVKLHGSGFIVTAQQAEQLGLGKRAGLDRHIRPYRNGRDLTATPRGVMVIDLFGLSSDAVRQKFPEVYQHLISTVKVAREAQHAKSPTRDAKEYLARWWTHGKPREELRPALAHLQRYVATPVTQKHRTFVFVGGDVLPDDALINIAIDDGYALGILSSRAHAAWIKATGGTLEDRPRYLKSLCFDPFPFPECSDDLKARVRTVAEELDALRKARQVEHPRLTLTQMYNVLEKIKAGEPLDADEERIKAEGLILILKELHEKLDALVFEAYGWPATLTDEDILTYLVELNHKRALEENVGVFKWLRPDYQIPRFGSDAERARLTEEKAKARQEELALADDDDDEETTAKPKFQTGNELAETADVMRVLATATEPLSIRRIARSFAQGMAIEKRVAMTILALARLGHLSSLDDGETFLLRRSA